LGELLHAEGNYSGPSGYRHSPGHWRLSRAENPAGGMAARGIHIVDAMIHTCGRIRSVYARSQRRVLDAEMDDTTAMLFEFHNGMTGSLATIMATAELWRLHLFGSAGWAKMECIEHIPSFTFETCSVDDEHTVVRYPAVNTERLELEAFAEASMQRDFPTVPVEHAVHGLSVWGAICESASSGKAAVVG
jgi:predicted dehydrogenase